MFAHDTEDLMFTERLAHEIIATRRQDPLFFLLQGMGGECRYYGGFVCLMRLVASRPSITGIRMSIQMKSDCHW
jgi:hypothetical protein